MTYLSLEQLDEWSDRGSIWYMHIPESFTLYEKSFPKGKYPYKIHGIPLKDGLFLTFQRFHSDGDVLFSGRVKNISTFRTIQKILKDT